VQVANGFYEWHVEPDGRKYPYYIHLSDQEVFGFASLWDRSKKADGTAIESTVLITMPANELMHEIHNTGNNPHRMPAILKPEDIETWLTGSAEEAAAVLTQYPPDLMVAYRVSPRVNTPKNDDPSLIEPFDEPANESGKDEGPQRDLF
jgi:putative SOS response-associated peptidase YedK